MPHRTFWNERGVIVVFYGHIDVDELNEANGIAYSHPRFEEINYELWNFSDADVSAIKPDDCRIPASTDAVAASYKNNCRVALVSSDEYAQSLFQAYADAMNGFGASWIIQPFEQFDQAVEWCEHK